MAISDPVVLDRPTDLYSSGVSWGAVIGGAFVAAAMALILLALGAGFELSAISPWSNVGVSTMTAGVAALIWLVVVEAVSSAMGGYLAGRLRTRWVSVHTDEVHFRDTANGFLVWAVSLVITASFLTTAAVGMVGGSVAAGEAAMAMNGAGRGEMSRTGYYVDRLFRSERAATGTSEAATTGEADRIMARLLRHRDADRDDTAYLAQLVAARTGMNQADAEKRVNATIDEARQAADTARRNAARLSFWIFMALLIGAFCASYAATIGGRQRDRVQAVQR